MSQLRVRKAFDDLSDVIENLGDTGKGLSWAKSQCDKLKQTKRYLKGDFKVRLVIINYKRIACNGCL